MLKSKDPVQSSMCLHTDITVIYGEIFSLLIDNRLDRTSGCSSDLNVIQKTLSDSYSLISNLESPRVFWSLYLIL
jgi:hypothetical protein